jgi:hypothetical protein
LERGCVLLSSGGRGAETVGVGGRTALDGVKLRLSAAKETLGVLAVGVVTGVDVTNVDGGDDGRRGDCEDDGETHFD